MFIFCRILLYKTDGRIKIRVSDSEQAINWDPDGSGSVARNIYVCRTDRTALWAEGCAQGDDRHQPSDDPDVPASHTPSVESIEEG